jgi:hypothetical protein
VNEKGRTSNVNGRTWEWAVQGGGRVKGKQTTLAALISSREKISSNYDIW